MRDPGGEARARKGGRAFACQLCFAAGDRHCAKTRLGTELLKHRAHEARPNARVPRLEPGVAVVVAIVVFAEIRRQLDTYDESPFLVVDGHDQPTVYRASWPGVSASYTRANRARGRSRHTREALSIDRCESPPSYGWPRRATKRFFSGLSSAGRASPAAERFSGAAPAGRRCALGREPCTSRSRWRTRACSRHATRGASSIGRCGRCSARSARRWAAPAPRTSLGATG